MRTLFILGFLAGLLSIASCTSDDYVRGEGIAFGAGNALAANTVMQMVDPWKDGVQNTKLRVPAARGQQGGAADDAAASKESQSTSATD